MIVLSFFWYQIFWNEHFLHDRTALLFAVIVGLTLFIVPFLYLIQRVEVYEDYFIYKGLFNRKKVVYKQIKYVGLEVSESRREDRETETFYSVLFLLNNRTKETISFVFLGKSVRGKPLIRKIIEKNPEVEIDTYVEKIKDGNRIISLEIIQFFLFLLINGLLFFIFSLIAN